MSGLAPLLRTVVGQLQAVPVAHALVGGLAVSVRTEPRFTRDVDLAVGVVDDAEAETLEVLPGVRVPVARTGHLIALKLLSRSDRRPQDEADLRRLLAVADTTEHERATSALTLIQHRGAHRDRDLLGDYDRLTAPD